MSVLDRVNSPKDLKKLNDKELEVLCEDKIGRAHV